MASLLDSYQDMTLIKLTEIDLSDQWYIYIS